jgi:hypothetical protein
MWLGLTLAGGGNRCPPMCGRQRFKVTYVNSCINRKTTEKSNENPRGFWDRTWGRFVSPAKVHEKKIGHSPKIALKGNSDILEWSTHS